MSKLMLVLLGAIALPVALVAYAFNSQPLFVAVISYNAVAITVGVLAFLFHHPRHSTVVPSNLPVAHHSSSDGFIDDQHDE